MRAYSEYDHEIPHSHTADQPTTLWAADGEESQNINSHKT